MVKIDRIEHNVTIPEGVTATISEDGVVTMTGPNGTLSREFVSSRVDILQMGRPHGANRLTSQKRQGTGRYMECSLEQHGEGCDPRFHLPSQGILLSLPNDARCPRTELCCQQLFR